MATEQHKDTGHTIARTLTGPVDQAQASALDGSGQRVFELRLDALLMSPPPPPPLPRSMAHTFVVQGPYSLSASSPPPSPRPGPASPICAVGALESSEPPQSPQLSSPYSLPLTGSPSRRGHAFFPTPPPPPPLPAQAQAALR